MMQTRLTRGAFTGGIAPTAFSGGRLHTAHSKCFTTARPTRQQPRSLKVQAGLEYPDEELTAYVEENFPEQGIANVEEARTLISELGYTYLDVRPEAELDAIGKVKGAVNIPIVIAHLRYDPEQGKRVAEKEDNPDFLAQVERKFPDKENAKLVVGCSNGRAYSMDALMALEEAGYVNLVGLKGGFRSWNRTFDYKLNRRRFGEYQENYGHGGDSAGIHGSGAGFEKMDGLERWVPPEF